MNNAKRTFPERVELLRKTSNFLHALAQSCQTPEVAQQLNDAADTVRLEVWQMEKAAQRFKRRVDKTMTARGAR
jgi:hypothetical protein